MVSPGNGHVLICVGPNDVGDPPMREVLEYERQIRPEIEKRLGPRSGLITPIVGTRRRRPKKPSWPSLTQTLGARVARLDTGMAWAEDPRSRTRHLLANIEVETGGAGSELKVRSNFIVYRSRSETEQDFYVGARRDVLRLVDGAWKIANRKLILDQNVLLAKNVSIFF
jgi:3-phenylpropionate/cinnamic acid dioxygenase small subunit